MNVSIKPPVIIVTANGISGNRAIAISAEIASNASSATAAAASAAAAALILGNLANEVTDVWIGNGTTGPFALSVDPVLASRVHVLDPVQQEAGIDYSIVAMPSAPSGKGILFVVAPVTGQRIRAQYGVPANYSVASLTYKTYPKRADMLADSVALLTLPTGTLVSAGGYVYRRVAGSTDIPDFLGFEPNGVSTPNHYGVVADGVADATNALQSWLNGSSSELFWTTGIYRVNGSLTLPSNKKISGVRGATILRQYGAYLFVGPDNLTNLHMSGLTLDYRRVGGNIYDTALSLRAHQYCIFEGLETLRYDGVTILERTPNAAATQNTVDNVYRDWNISACAVLDVAIGLEGYYYKHTGDGVATIIATNVVWPELFNSSVVVLKENASRGFTELTLTADYTISYDGANKLIVTMVVAPTALERIHIWPSAPRTDGNRRPISNNLFENIRCLYVFKRGHQAVRWVDAETYRFERLLAAADFVYLYVTNPYSTRDGQGGDYAAYEDSILGYQTALVPTPTTLRGFDFGPGSTSMSGRGIRADQTWYLSGSNRLMAYRDGRVFNLTGTVSGTTGTTAVTGVGTKFKDQLTRVGANADLVQIEGVYYAIASINSDTSLTLSTNLTTSPAGVVMSRINKTAAVGFDMDFASVGNGFYSTGSNQSARALRGSVTENSGTAIILNTATSVIVTHGLMRAPLVHEISLTSGSALNGRSMSVANMTSTTFQIFISSAATADFSIGWRCKLVELN